MGFFDKMPGVGDVLNAGVDWLQWEGQKDFARENRNFMASREDSAVQRRVRDLIAAGLNPMLAYGGQAGSAAFASQPSGFSPSESLSRGATRDLASAQAAKVRAETTLVDAQRDNIEMDTRLKGASAVQAGAHTDLMRATLPKLEAEIKDIYKGMSLKDAEIELKRILAAKDAYQLKQIMPHLRKLAQDDAYRSELGLPKHENMNAVEKSWWGIVKQFVPFGQFILP